MLILSSPGSHLNLPSFPTRRSSDLELRDDLLRPLGSRIELESQLRVELEPRIERGRAGRRDEANGRSEEHTSELQSLTNLVCRLLLEKKKHRRTSHLLAQAKEREHI